MHCAVKRSEDGPIAPKRTWTPNPTMTKMRPSPDLIDSVGAIQTLKDPNFIVRRQTTRVKINSPSFSEPKLK